VSGADVEDAPRRQTVVGVRGERCRLLVVDDKEDNRRLLRDLLTPIGFEIAEADGADACFTMLGADRPDGILLDLRMPGMGGLDVARRIRAAERGSRVAIIAVSASAFDHHRQECLDAGADDFIAKPFRLDALLDLLCRHLGLEPIYGTAPSAREISGLEPDTLPPPEDLAELLDLARRGSVRRIVERVARLEADGRYASFAGELDRLARRFQLKQLCQFLEEAAMRQTPSSSGVGEEAARGTTSP